MGPKQRFQVSAKVDRVGRRFELTALSGRLGRSDVEGRLVLDGVGHRMHITGALASKHLDFADLAVSHTRSPVSRSRIGPRRKPMQSSGRRLLSDAPLPVGLLRPLDLQLRYRAETVRSTQFPLRRLGADVKLDHGVLLLKPLTLQFTRGVLSGSVRIDARAAVPETTLDVSLRDFRLDDIIRHVGGVAPLQVPLAVRARLVGHGASIHQAAATASGRILAFTSQGTMRRSVANLIGNAGGGLARLLPNKSPTTPLRCGFIDLQGSAGRFQFRRATVDTGVVTLRGTGSVDLAGETIAMKVQGTSKQPALLRYVAPINVTGAFRAPTLGIDPLPLAAQAVSGVLASVALPLSKAVPFLKGKAAPDVDCRNDMGRRDSRTGSE